MTAYIIKVILCSALFILTYNALLEKGKMHQFNRFYLLSGLVLSFVIPSITFSSYSPVVPTIESSLLITEMTPDFGNMQQTTTAEKTSNYFLFLLIAYTVITTFLLSKFIINLKVIFHKTRNNTIIPYKGSKLVLSTENLTPHSFLSYIFLNQEEYDNGNIEREILTHELLHTQQKHSYDILFLEVLRVFFWFNPFLFFFKKAIQLNHEFLADEAVIRTYHNTASYQHLLIDNTYKLLSSTLTSQFTYSITKKRLLMMTKTKSFRNALCRQIAVIPVLAMAIFIFSTKTFAQNTLPVPKTKQKEAPSTQEGVSQELLNEYEQIVNKAKNEEVYLVPSKFSETDKARLETIFFGMSKEQQAKQIVRFIPNPPPLPKIVPTKAQIESWKNSKVYGVWIDNKRINNAELSNYQNTDFSQAFVSKLSRSAVNYGKHFYQVDLMTNEAYKKYYKQKVESQNRYLLVTVTHYPSK
ncbi:MAG TPA: M56 family metallopeptidase [Daejeonella sp.]|nr:M56 family metallopeptidase [Daejeonella sp.]